MNLTQFDVRTGAVSSEEIEDCSKYHQRDPSKNTIMSRSPGGSRLYQNPCLFVLYFTHFVSYNMCETLSNMYALIVFDGNSWGIPARPYVLAPIPKKTPNECLTCRSTFLYLQTNNNIVHSLYVRCASVS